MCTNKLVLSVLIANVIVLAVGFGYKVISYTFSGALLFAVEPTELQAKQGTVPAAS